ncbi:MAG: hypothetical protein ACLRMX_07325 [Lachnospira eligens]
MTNVLAPRIESVKSAQGYSDSNRAMAFIFRIPPYENMPEKCMKFDRDSSPNNRLSDLYVEGYSLTPHLVCIQSIVL